MSVNDTRFTALSIEAIFGSMKQVKRRLLKSQIPALRNVRPREVIDFVIFNSDSARPFHTAIELSDDAKYEFHEIGHRTTEVSKYAWINDVEASDQASKREILDTGMDDLLERFVRTKLNKKRTVIAHLAILGKKKVLEYFRLLKVEIEYLYIDPGRNDTIETLEAFMNVPSIQIEQDVLSNEMMDEILNLKASFLHLTASIYPDGRLFELKNETLIVAEKKNTLQHFIKFLKKLATGAHKCNSYYFLTNFTDNNDSDEIFFDRVGMEFPSSRMTTTDKEWQFPMEFFPDQLTIWISEELELNVSWTGGGARANVEERGTAEPPI